MHDGDNDHIAIAMLANDEIRKSLQDHSSYIPARIESLYARVAFGILFNRFKHFRDHFQEFRSQTQAPFIVPMCRFMEFCVCFRQECESHSGTFLA